jgi:hypothetical protein
MCSYLGDSQFMPTIFEELLLPLPDLSAVSAKSQSAENELILLREIKLLEILAIETAYFKLNTLIQSIYGALFYADLTQNADALLPLVIEFLPADKALLKNLQGKAALLFHFYNNKRDAAEKAYNSLTLLNAITAKYATGSTLQQERDKLVAQLSEKDIEENLLRKWRAEKTSLEKLISLFQPLKEILTNARADIDNEIKTALSPQKQERIKLEEELNALLKKEKELLTAKMIAMQKQVLNQAEYKIKNSIFFSQKRLDLGNTKSALLAEALSKITLFEHRQLNFTELMEALQALAKQTTSTSSASSQAALDAEAAPLVLETCERLLQLKDKIVKKEEELAKFNEVLEETEKALRINKIKRALRQLEQNAALASLEKDASSVPALSF